MIKPEALKADESVTKVGEIFDTPIVVVDKTWLPITQIVVWGIMTKLAMKRYSERPFRESATIGGLQMATILGSEWCHNLAHAAAAKLVGKPMDALRITWGMPLCVYYQLNDESVSPSQHIFRALGGPIINTLLLGLVRILRNFTQKDSIPRQVANAGVDMNTFLATASLLPIPGIDGGPVLKWGLVESGHTIEEADEMVKQVNKVTGACLGIATAVAVKKERRFLGVILGMFSSLALGVGFGLLKEQ